MQVEWAKIVILNQYLVLGSMTDGVWSTIWTVDRGIVYSTWRRPLFVVQTAMHQWILFITAPTLWTTIPKRTEQNLIICFRKCEAEVTNNKRLRSRYCTLEA